MKKFHIDPVKAVGVAGTVLGLAATLLSGWSDKKSTNETIAKEVAKALAEQKTKES